MEPYLSQLDFAGRTTLSQFRCRSNKLPIATSYHHSQDPLPFCSCNTGSVADGFHLLLQCSHFSRARSELLKPRFNKRPNILKMADLFCGDVSAMIRIIFDAIIRLLPPHYDMR